MPDNVLCDGCTARGNPDGWPEAFASRGSADYIICAMCGRTLVYAWMDTRYYLGLVKIKIGLPLECRECMSSIKNIPYVVMFSSWGSDASRPMHRRCARAFLEWIRFANGVETWAAWETDTPDPLHFFEREWRKVSSLATRPR